MQTLFAFIQKWGGLYLKGTGVTLLLSAIGVVVGVLLALLVTTMRRSENKILHGISTAYVEILRGTPLVVQVMLAYYGFSSILPDSLDFLKNAYILSTLALCCNSSAYISEILRGGIQSVERGQSEAAYSLGLTQKQTNREIIYPQALKIVLPSLANEFITLIKESAIVAFVGIADLMYQAKVISGSSYRYFMSYTIAAVIYFVIVFGLSKLLQRYERRLNASDLH